MSIESAEKIVGMSFRCPSATLGQWHTGKIIKTENPDGSVTFGCECGGGWSVTCPQRKAGE